MEQTVKDVLPALTTNSEGLKKVLEDLVKQYRAKQDELDKWKVGHMQSRIGLLLHDCADLNVEEEQYSGGAILNGAGEIPSYISMLRVRPTRCFPLRIQHLPRNAEGRRGPLGTMDSERGGLDVPLMPSAMRLASAS